MRGRGSFQRGSRSLDSGSMGRHSRVFGSGDVIRFVFLRRSLCLPLKEQTMMWLEAGVQGGGGGSFRARHRADQGGSRRMEKRGQTGNISEAKWADVVTDQT